MPEPADLRLDTAGGRVVISVGPVVLFEYDAADAVMRNIAISALMTTTIGLHFFKENYITHSRGARW